MSLVTVKYFVGEINVVNWNETPICQRLTLMIRQRETEFLEYALGYAFSQLFTDGVVANVPKFLTLKNGGTYKHRNGGNVSFRGLAKDELSFSAIANYVYYWWCRDNDSQSTTMGEVDTATDSKKVSANPKAVKAFNAAARDARDMWNFLQNAVDNDGVLIYGDFEAQCVNSGALKVINVFGL